MSARPANTRKRLRDLLAAYLDELRSLHMSPLTLRSIRYGNLGFLTWLEETFRVRHVDELRPRQLTAWLKHLSEYRTSKGLDLNHLEVTAGEKALFLDPLGKRYPYYTFRRRLHAYAGKAGIDIQVTPPTPSAEAAPPRCFGAAPTCTTSRRCSVTSPSTPSSTTPG